MHFLQSLYQKQVEKGPSFSSTFDRVVYDFFEHQSLPSIEEWEESVEECAWQETFLGEERGFENWKRLLALNFFRSFTSYSPDSLAAKVRSFGYQPWNQHSPYFRALVALNHAFVQMPVPDAVPPLLDKGAALIEVSEYCPWMALPYTPYHLELGLFLSLLGLLTQGKELQVAASQIGRWQCNTLDGEGHLFRGLFVREREGKHFSHLCVSYLFFRSLAVFDSDSLFAEASERAMQEMQKQNQERVSSLWVLIEKWLAPYSFKATGSFSLPEFIYDPSVALVGYRSSAQHVVCTLHGGHTGLGTIRKGGVEIVSYGPQHLPLEDCRGFGIEGNLLSDHGIRKSVIACKPHAFSLKGCTRLVDRPSSSPLGEFRGIWLEVEQAFKASCFCLDVRLLGLEMENWEALSFSFFVRAEKCLISSLKILQPRTLERYEGKGEELTFEGEQGKVKLESSSFQGILQVVPLAGENHFWGADFLVAYLLDPKQAAYQWRVSF